MWVKQVLAQQEHLRLAAKNQFEAAATQNGIQLSEVAQPGRATAEDLTHEILRLAIHGEEHAAEIVLRVRIGELRRRHREHFARPRQIAIDARVGNAAEQIGTDGHEGGGDDAALALVRKAEATVEKVSHDRRLRWEEIPIETAPSTMRPSNSTGPPIWEIFD